MRPSLERLNQIDELVANQARVEAEKESQEQSGSKLVKKAGLGQKNKRQYTCAGHREFRHGKGRNTLPQYRAHYRVHLDHASVDQLQRHERIDTTHQHDTDGEKEQPRMVPIQKHDIIDFRLAPRTVTSGPGETVKHGSPAELTPITVCSLVDYRST